MKFSNTIKTVLKIYQKYVKNSVWFGTGSLWRNLRTGTPPNFFSAILCFVALVYNWYFFQNNRFSLYGNYSTLDSHTNNVISHTFAYSSRWRPKPWQGLFTRHYIAVLSVCDKFKLLGHVQAAMMIWVLFSPFLLDSLLVTVSGFIGLFRSTCYFSLSSM